MTDTISTAEHTAAASTLAADWAATLDSLKLHWAYERGVFHLPDHNVWAAVGTGNDALPSGDRDNIRDPMAIVLAVPTPDGMARWTGAGPAQDIILAHCPNCDTYTFMDINGAWQCRRCYYGGHPQRHDNKFWQAHHCRSGELRFTRAPRGRG